MKFRGSLLSKRAVAISIALVCCGGVSSADKPFAFERVAVHQFEDGPILGAKYEFLPGETIFFSSRVDGYKIEKKEDEPGHVKLKWEVEIHDPAGALVEKPKTEELQTQVLLEDKNWLPKYVTTFLLPSFVPGGEYKITVRVTDELAAATLSGELKILVKGPQAPAETDLTARNFRFLRTDEDRFPLRDPVFHPSETLWARFDIVGYKLGANNHFNVDYGVAVLNAEGKQVYAQEVAAQESKESFYPQRWVAGAFNLNLNPDVPKGAYTLVVTVHDKEGSHTLEKRADFRIE